MIASDRRIIKRLNLHLLAPLILCLVLNNLDRLNLSFAALTMNREIGLGHSQFGFGAGIFFVSYATLALPSNLMLHRYGAKIWISFILVGCGMAAAAMAGVQGPGSFYFVRFLFGAAESGLTPGIILYITLWYPETYRAAAYSVLTSSVAISGVFAGPFSATIIENFDGILRLSGWRWMFVLQGVPVALLGVSMGYWLTASPGKASWLDWDERAWLTKRLDAERSNKKEHNFSDAIRSGRVWLLASMYFLFLMVFSGLQLWMPQIIKAAGQTSAVSANVLSAGPSVVAVAMTALLGFSSDFHGERRLHLALPLLIGGGCLIVSSFLMVRPVLAYSVFSLAWGMLFAPIGIFWAVASATLTGVAAAAGLAFINTIAQLGGFLGPYLIGELRERTGDFSVAVISSGCIIVVAGVLGLTLKPGQNLLSRHSG